MQFISKHESLFFFILSLKVSPLVIANDLGLNHAGMAKAPLSHLTPFEALQENPSQLELLQGGHIGIVSPLFIRNEGGSKLLALAQSQNSQKQVETLQALKDEPTHLGFFTFSGYASAAWSFGLLASATGDARFEARLENAGLEHLDARLKQNSGIFLARSHAFWDRHILLGLTLKALHRKQTTLFFPVSAIDTLGRFKMSNFTASGYALGSDFGLSYRVEPTDALGPQVAMTIKDIGDTTYTQSSNTSPIDPLPQTLNLGFSWASPWTESLVSQFHLQFADFLSRTHHHFPRKLRLGSRLLMLDRYYGDIGIHHGYFSGAMGYQIGAFQFELGTLAYEHGQYSGEHQDRRYFAQIQIITN